MTDLGSAHGRVAVGHPIDVATGEFFATHVDHELEGVVPLSLGRRFSTNFLARPAVQQLGPRARFEPFGPGWRPSWWAELRGALGGGFVYVRADGTEFAISNAPGAGGFGVVGRIVAPEHGLQLERVDETRVRVVGFGSDRAETALVFERIGVDDYRLASFERTQLGRIDVVYDERGRPAHLLQVREQQGYSFTYDEGGRIVEAQRRLPDRSRRPAARYVYTADGRLSEVHDARGLSGRYEYDEDGRVVRDETRGGKIYTIRYDRRGRCVYASGSDRYEERLLKFNPAGRTTWVTNSHGQVTTYEYNLRGQVVKTTSPTGEVTRAEFDEYGRPATQTLETGEIHRHAYDELGRRVRLKSSYGWEQRRYYDGAHRLIVAEEWARRDNKVALRARAMRFGYDAEHNVTSVQHEPQPPWRYEWTPFGELASSVDPAGARRTWARDERGNVARATNAEGHVWQWTHDVLGRPITETDPLGHARRVEFLDDEGLSLRVHDPDGRSYERQTSPDERTVRVVLPGGATRTTQLNSCGWPIAIWDEVGACTQLRWGTEPGELLSILDANSAEYTFAYDADQRVVRRSTFDGRVLGTEWKQGRVVATVDGAGQRTELVYDSFGRVTEQVRVDGSTRLEYDARGMLSGVISPEATLRFERDASGRIVAEDQDGVRLTRQLDVMGRPVSYHSDYGVDTTFGWSASDRCATVRHGEAAITFTRDAMGREVGRDLAGAGRFEQSYDSVGRLTGQVFRSVSGGGAAQVQRAFSYDARGFLLEIQDSLRGRTELRHNDRGDLTGVLRERGWSDVAAFDGCQNRVYYAQTEHSQALALAFRAAERSRAQGYDEAPVDRVIAATPHVGTAQAYTRGNRVVSLDKTDGTRVELEYDANGCVVTKTKLRGPQRETWRFGWDSRQRMTSMMRPDGAVWRYRYDATARRIEKQSPTGETWRYVWRGQDMADVLHDGALVEGYLHEPGGTCPLLRQDETGVHYILPDQNDGPSEEVDGVSGAVGWQATKGTWAEGWLQHGHAGGEPFLGQWFDAESGLHYNRFRYYDPYVGRYLTPDPVDLHGGFNHQLYSASPFSTTDRHGLADDSSTCGPAKGLIGSAFEEWLVKRLGGTSGAFKLGGREFDGARGTRWWEAKSGRYWEDHAGPGPGFDKFKSDMGSRLKIASNNGSTIEVHSNTPIPDHAKSWLDKSSIPFFQHE